MDIHSNIFQYSRSNTCKAWSVHQYYWSVMNWCHCKATFWRYTTHASWNELPATRPGKHREMRHSKIATLNVSQELRLSVAITTFDPVKYLSRNLPNVQIFQLSSKWSSHAQMSVNFYWFSVNFNHYSSWIYGHNSWELRKSNNINGCKQYTQKLQNIHQQYTQKTCLHKCHTFAKTGGISPDSLPQLGHPNFEVEQQVDTLNCWDPWGIFEESASPADVVFMMSFPTCFFWLNLKMICGSSDVKQIWSSIHVIISQDDGSSSRWNTEEKQLFICINMIFFKYTY